MIRSLPIVSVALLLTACGASQSRSPATAAEMGEPSDDIDPEVIGEAVRNNSSRFRFCYEQGRELNPGLAGRVQVRFVINPDGTVAQAAVTDTDLPSLVTSCVLDGFYHLQLPSQKAAITAEYPMFFQPG